MKQDRFARFAWGVLIYNLLVVLWGAFVRATGSGAGCGSHWPKCNGVFIPHEPSVKTVIEFAHRTTSGLALVFVVIMAVWAFRSYPRSHSVRLGAGLSLLFIISEALVGAGLVLFSLVAENASMVRAFSISIHLVNTFLLLGALTLTAWWASGGAAMWVRGHGRVAMLLGMALLGLLLVGMSGAITALGDTLFPAASLAEGFAQDFSPGAHLLIRLRIWHPVLAILIGLFTVVTARYVSAQRPGRTVKQLAQALAVLFGIQLFVGSLNVALLAPVWMQLVHLLLADLVWIALVLLTGAVLVRQEAYSTAASRVEGQAVVQSSPVARAQAE